MPARFALACVLFASIAVAQSHEDPAVTYARRVIAAEKAYRPAAGYITNSDTAIAVAIAVLTPIYGKADIDAEKPWHTGLRNSVWTVVGTFNGPGVGGGGEAIIQLDEKTGAVIFVGHTM